MSAMRMRRCPTCGGLAVLGDSGLRYYSCGKAIEDPQKRLGEWAEQGDEDGS